MSPETPRAVWLLPVAAFAIAALLAAWLGDSGAAGPPAPVEASAARPAAARVPELRLGHVPALPAPLRAPKPRPTRSRPRTDAVASRIATPAPAPPPADPAPAPSAPTPAPAPRAQAPAPAAPVAPSPPSPTPAPTFDDSGSGPQFESGGGP